MENDNSNTEEQVNTEQKQTNKTFTQSEQDKAIAEAVQRATSQFGDYNEKIKELETLKKATLERERAEMSELEQAREMLKEAEEKVVSLSSENMEFKKTTIKNNVLNNSKYSNLPRAYKNMVVASDNEEAVLKSADDILLEYQKDTNQTVQDNFGGKKLDDQSLIVKSPEEIKSGLSAKIMETFKNKGLVPK